jgi:MFS family permease
VLSRQYMRAQVLLLSAAQALFQTASVLVMTIGGLAGAQVAASPQLATAPIAAMFLGTTLGTAPASLWMARAGRRTGFIAGASLGVAGGLVAAYGVYTSSLILLCVGTFLVGAYQGFAQFYRFAAAEVADEDFRPKAIAYVLAGGIVAAVLGPALARVGGPLLAPAYVGSFLLLSVTSLVAAALLVGLKVPPPPHLAHGARGRPLGQIMRQPQYAVALFGAATGAGVMVLAMTATPIAMMAHQHDLGDAAMVIQLHVLGMFAPSFFTGSLIARFGVLRIMLAGVVLLVGHVAISLSGHGFASYAVALALVGTGWNFLYTGGTTLLTGAYTPAERGRAQAANDVTIFAVGLLGSLSAGALLELVGWRTMNALLLPWLAAAGLAIVWFGAGRAQTAPEAEIPKL